MAVELPVFPEFAAFQYTATIDGAEYLLRWQWVERAASWYFDILETDETPILLGRRVAVSWSLNLRAKDSRLPDGVFFVVDVSGENAEIRTRDELGERVRVLFIPRDEFPPPTARPDWFRVVVPEF